MARIIYLALDDSIVVDGPATITYRKGDGDRRSGRKAKMVVDAPQSTTIRYVRGFIAAVRGAETRREKALA